MGKAQQTNENTQDPVQHEDLAGQNDQEAAAKEARIAELERQLADFKSQVEALEAKAEAAEAAAADALKRIPNTAAADEQAALEDLRNQKKYVLTINSTEKERGPVPIGINGAACLVKRDTEVLVPEGVINVLNLATIGNAVQEEINGAVVTRFQTSKRYAYSYREASADDIARLESKHAGK